MRPKREGALTSIITKIIKKTTLMILRIELRMALVLARPMIARELARLVLAKRCSSKSSLA